MARIIDEFCGQKNGYSRSITLRNRLVPIGKTEENVREFLEKDKERAMVYPEIKGLIDSIHRNIIEESLCNVSFFWEKLFSQFELYQQEKDKAKKATCKKELESIQKSARRAIVKAFTENKDFDKLFKDGLFKELLPCLIECSPEDEIADKKKALETFNRFSTYFTGFHENRRNIYSDEAKSTSIANRIVHENFPKFFANVKVFDYLESNFPQIIKDAETSLQCHLQGKSLKEIFTPAAFGEVLTQSGIDFYNTGSGGISGEAGTEKIQGLNEKINLARQQLPGEDKNKLRSKMVVLFKQILSDRETVSFIPVGFEKNEDVYSSIKQFDEDVVTQCVEETKELFAQGADFNLDEIYVPAKSLANFSQTIFGSWSRLQEGLFLLEKDKIKKALSENQEDKINKEIVKRDHSFVELQAAFERYCKEHNQPVDKFCKDYFDAAIYRAIDAQSEKTRIPIMSQIIATRKGIDFEEVRDLQQEKEAAVPVKAYLDEVQNLYHHLKLVDYRGEEQKDSNFYSKYDEILIQLSEIIPLYNKVRNFVTKKLGESKKIKLNFDCPTLANGWDENQESSNDAIILRKDGKYYLGIYNPNNKPKFAKKDSIVGDCYEKMAYKQIALPMGLGAFVRKCFGTAQKYGWGCPENCLNSEGKIIIKDEEAKGNLEAIIDCYKDFLNKYEKDGFKYKDYNFSFLDSASYEKLSDFFNDVKPQGYKLSFTSIPLSEIDKMIDEGKLFLFQIYNKDFAKKATGKKNLHTLYWENLFSVENLQDVVLKLNGEAELFWREASIKKEKVIVHKKGSILVNRTTTDGKSIPEAIYQEIYQLKNKMADSISDEAKRLLESGTVVCKVATHDIVKDKHFTENTYLFHCPITMNFKAKDRTNKEFNNHVLEVLNKNPDIKVIGLDRGERHLLYLSLINQKGEIECQKTLNLVEQVRNDKTVSVNYHEKLVHKEGSRDAARKNWQTIGNIKELKEGYLSAVVHEIASLMVKHNAIVVMEDLNFGFKRGRFAVERQIYQKFENMLIEKLNYLVFKDRKVTEPGGVLNAYQLANKSAKVTDVYKQCGWLFYIPAAYTSKIDPRTGFANLFITKGLTNVEKKKEFFGKFDSIRYDATESCFVFSFDYAQICDNADYKKKWDVYTRGTRLVYNKTERKNVSVNPTEELQRVFDEFGIKWNTGEDLIESISLIPAEKSNAKFFDILLRMFNATLQMRNSVPNTDTDYLVSPVKAEDGSFFDSREEFKKGGDARLPIDCDANGAYHIALKGLYLLLNDFNRDNKGVIQNISNKDWFKFVQEKVYKD